MPYFKAKIAILLIGIFFLAGCSLPKSSIIDNASDKLEEKTQNKLQENLKEDVYILFVGDLMFDRSIREFTNRKGNDFIFEKISDFLKGNDLVVANLEGPITDNKSVSVGTTPGQKGHFIFTFDKSLADTLAKNNIKLVSLGNNHVLNFGVDGLDQTKKYLTENGIDYFGDPKNKENNSIVKEINGIKIGLVNYNQFGGISVEEVNKNIEMLRNTVDIVVIYAHWGKEYEKNPSDKIKNLAHNFVDAGADLIIGSHPHVVQNMEEYKGKRIYYSLGNFIFDQYFSAETMNGLAVRIKIDAENRSMEFQEIPLIMERNGQTKPVSN
ncbi:MAG: CapA family protein [Patescibacteria group bacterium]